MYKGLRRTHVEMFVRACCKYDLESVQSLANKHKIEIADFNESAQRLCSHFNEDNDYKKVKDTVDDILVCLIKLGANEYKTYYDTAYNRNLLKTLKVLFEDDNIHAFDDAKSEFYNLNLLDGDLMISSFSKVCYRGSIDIIKYLAEEISKRYGSEYLTNGFDLASSGNKIDIVKYLAETYNISHLKHAVRLAAAHGCIDVYKYLIEERINKIINKSIDLGEGFVSAVCNRHTNIMEYIISCTGLNGIHKLNAEHMRRAMRFACFNKSFKMTKLLLSIKDPDICYDSKYAISEGLRGATSVGCLKIVKYLVKRYAEKHFSFELHRGGEYGFYARGSVVKKIPDGYTVIHKGEEITELSEEKGMVEDKEEGMDGVYPLVLCDAIIKTAVRHGHLNIIKYYIEKMKVADAEDIYESYINSKRPNVIAYFLNRFKFDSGVKNITCARKLLNLGVSYKKLKTYKAKDVDKYVRNRHIKNKRIYDCMAKCTAVPGEVIWLVLDYMKY